MPPSVRATGNSSGKLGTENLGTNYGSTLTGVRTLVGGDYVKDAEGDTLKMQLDGNLVLYNSTGVSTWSSDTAGKPGAFAVMQDDCNFVVYDRMTSASTTGVALWSSRTRVNPVTLPTQYSGETCIVKLKNVDGVPQAEVDSVKGSVQTLQRVFTSVP